MDFLFKSLRTWTFRIAKHKSNFTEMQFIAKRPGTIFYKCMNCSEIMPRRVPARCMSTLRKDYNTQHLKSYNFAALPKFQFRGLKTEQNPADSTDERTGVSLGKRLMVVATIGGLVYYCLRSVDRQKDIDTEKYRYSELQKAQLGGDWILTDQYGKQRSSTEFRGQWILMYFGFSHCPDICPEELEKLIKIVKIFDSDPTLPNMLPIFISLDPERDSPSVIKDYLADLKYPRMLGFTGSLEDITQVAKKFRAYFKKGPVDSENDYIVDHTIVIYLINPEGQFVNYYDRSRKADRIVKSVKEHIAKYKSLEKEDK